MSRAVPVLLALALLALGGCSLFAPKQQDPAVALETGPEYQACRAEARGSPQNRALDGQSNPMNPWNVYRIGIERQDLETRLYRDCLRARGLTLPGGVESLKPR
jgi:hypothetical protein